MEINVDLFHKILNAIDLEIVFVDNNNELVIFNLAAGEQLNLDPEERMGTSVLRARAWISI